MPPSERQPEVSLTLKAREKAHRLYNEYELRDRVRDERGTIFRKGESDEYHLVESGRSIVVVIEDDGSRTVTTQMHAHPDYHTDNRYQQLGELPRTPIQHQRRAELPGVRSIAMDREHGRPFGRLDGLFGM